MAAPKKPGVNWVAIRKRFESGETAHAIAKSGAGVTRQTIESRAKREGWYDGASIVEKFKPPTTPSSKATPDTKRLILEYLQDGLSQKRAAALAGVAEHSVINWRKADEAFDAACRQAAQVFAKRHIGNIARAGDIGDWRASAYLLERHPETKQDFGGTNTARLGAGGIQVILNVPLPTATDPDGTPMIEGEARDVTPSTQTETEDNR